MAIEIVEPTNTPNEGRVIWNDDVIELEGRINEVELGIDAFSTTSASFVQPAVSSTVSVEVDETGWMAVGQPVYMTTGGVYTVSSVTDTTHVVLTNLGYSGNAAVAATVASGKKVSPSGFGDISTPDATETVKGKAEIATQAETDTGTDDTRFITPLKLASYSGLGAGGGSDAAWLPVRIMSSSNLTLSGEQTIDDVLVHVDERVLVNGQSSAPQNGIYIVASGAWARADDANDTADFRYGKLVLIEEGNLHGGSLRYQGTSTAIVVGTDGISFYQAGGYGSDTTFGLARKATQSEINAGDSSGAPAYATPETLSSYALINKDSKPSVRVATTANITLSGAQTIDGISVVAGNRVLVKNQSTGSQNGIYLCASGAWTRTTDADTSAKVTPQMTVRVEEGTANVSKEFYLSNTGTVTLGTTALTFAEVTGASASAASETVAGIAELATQTETDTGTDDVRIVTPLKAATRFLAKAGGTLTGFLSLHADPTSDMHAVTKQYADGLVAGGASPASETVAGIAELATQTETNTGTDDARIVTPLKLASRTATDTRAGVVELATDGETQTGTDTARAITPANLSARSATETRSGIAEIATQTETDTGTDDTRMVTPLKLASYSGLGGGSGYATLVTLGSDVSTTVFSYADVTALSVAVSSGVPIRFRFTILFGVSATAMGSRWSINGPGITSLGYFQRFATGNAGNAVTDSARSTYDTSSTTGGTPSASGNLAVIEGILVPSASGTLIARFSTDGTSGTVTAKAGSTLEWW